MNTVTKRGVLDMQVCVDKSATDEEVVEFANSENPTGISAAWCIRKEGNKYLNGAPERVQCDKYPDNVHIMLEC